MNYALGWASEQAAARRSRNAGIAALAIFVVGVAALLGCVARAIFMVLP